MTWIQAQISIAVLSDFKGLRLRSHTTGGWTASLFEKPRRGRAWTRN
jgi:hypothetical protein